MNVRNISEPAGEMPGSSTRQSPLRVLIAEDEPTLRESCRMLLQQEGYEVVGCGRGDEARDMVQRRRFDVALVDMFLPQVSGMDVLEACLGSNAQMHVIMMTGNPSVESSLSALQAGAWEYLPKPFTASHLQVLFGRVLHAVARSRRNEEEEPLAAQEADDSGMLLLGRSRAFQDVLRLAQQVARTDASVLLTGESGSGKEMIAQYIHRNSRRSKTALVALNCAALPESLLESEMFGHVKGAFTGAIRDKPGLLEAAHQGTLFLDELTEMAPPIQAKLLRVLQDGVVRRVGSETTDARVDVRFIAATNRDPLGAVEEGVLRKDVFYRLSVVPIRVPSLRERLEDVPLLAEHFLNRYWRKHREKRTQVPTFSPEAMHSLQARRWSGNVRELQNLIEHTVVLLEPGAVIRPDDLPFRDMPEGELEGDFGATPVSSSELLNLDYHHARERLLTDFERTYITELIRRSNGNLSRAAKRAGVDRTTLYRLMEKHSMQQSAVLTAR